MWITGEASPGLNPVQAVVMSRNNNHNKGDNMKNLFWATCTIEGEEMSFQLRGDNFVIETETATVSVRLHELTKMVNSAVEVFECNGFYLQTEV